MEIYFTQALPLRKKIESKLLEDDFVDKGRPNTVNYQYNPIYNSFPELKCDENIRSTYLK